MSVIRDPNAMTRSTGSDNSLSQALCPRDKSKTRPKPTASASLPSAAQFRELDGEALRLGYGEIGGWLWRLPGKDKKNPSEIANSQRAP